MLRINLLPPYIYDAAKRRNVVIVWVVVLLAVIGGMIALKANVDKETDKIKSDQAAIEGTAKKADDDQTLANSINTQSAATREKATFVKNSRDHDAHDYPDSFENVAAYTWNRVLYDSIQPQGDTVAMSAYTRSLADVGQYILAMERNPNVSRVDIRMNSIPGFPSAPGASPQTGSSRGVRPFTGGGHDFDVTLHLYKPIPGGPSYPAGGGGGGGGGGGFGGGMSPMGPGGSMGGGGMPGMSMGNGMMSGGGMGSGGMSGKAGSAQ